MKKFPLFRPLSSSSIMVINVIVIVIVMVAITAIAVKAFTGPGANQPPSGSPTASLGGVPSGAVMFFNLDACPSGWTEYTAARGRVVVGTPLSGTNASTTGTALTNLGARTITDVPSHLHAVDPPSTNSSSAGSHVHDMTRRTSSYYNTPEGSAQYKEPWGYGNDYTEAAGAHTHTTDITSFNSASTGSASVDVTMPYIQLRACSKD